MARGMCLRRVGHSSGHLPPEDIHEKKRAIGGPRNSASVLIYSEQTTAERTGTGERAITTTDLNHEIGDDSMKGRPLVSW